MNKRTAGMIFKSFQQFLNIIKIVFKFLLSKSNKLSLVDIVFPPVMREISFCHFVQCRNTIEKFIFEWYNVYV